MALVKYVQNAFNKGETGPYYSARADKPDYHSAAIKIENFTCLPQGGLDHRRGSQYVDTIDIADAKLSNMAVWDYNSEQQYLLVFIDSEIRIYRDNDLKATIVSPYYGEDLRDLRFTQSGDVMVIVHGQYEPRGLERKTSDSDWELGVIDFVAIPYYRYNSAQTMTPSGTSGSITLTLNPTTDYFTSDHIGVNISINGGIAKITSVTNGYTVVATTSANLSSTAASSAWKEEVWSPAKGFPRTATFHQNRLWFGGVYDAPDVIMASMSGDFFNFTTGSNDGDAFLYTISSDQVQTIRDIKSQGGLNVFTSEGQFIVRPTNESVTATNVSIDQQGQDGIFTVPVTQVGNEIIFVIKNAREVRSFVYDYSSDSYVTINQTAVANHLFNDGTEPRKLAFLKSYRDTQSNMIFVPRNDGEMAVLTIDTSNKVLAWSRFVTDGEYADACVCNVAAGGAAQQATAYFMVQRDNGVFLEALTEDGVYLDHYYYGLSGTAKTTWWGMDTLVGRTIRAVADSFVQNPVMVAYKTTAAAVQDGGTSYEEGDILTVVGGTGDAVQLQVDTVSGGVITAVTILEPRGNYSVKPSNPVSVAGGSGSGATFNLTLSGGFTLPGAVSEIYAGLEYTAELETMEYNIAINGNSMTGERIARQKVQVSLLDTLSLTIEKFPVSFRSMGPTLLDQPLVPYTGKKEKRLLGFSTSPSLHLYVREPLPCTILAISTELSFPQ